MITLGELEALVGRATAASMKVDDPSLALALRSLSEAADYAHAALFRKLVQDGMLREARGEMPEEPVEPPSSPPEAPEEPEAGEDTPEAEDVSRSPLAEVDRKLAEGPVFRVRPRSSTRRCSVCGEPQWKRASGWVCNRGHEGAEPLDE